MGWGTGNLGGGSGGLNFKIVSYATESELLADTPKENTIGVVPYVDFTNWVFIATEPAEPEVGMLWFGVGDSSPLEFNAIKKNTLQVYPISAKQYVSNKWKDIHVFSYDGEMWRKLTIPILSLFKEFTEARENGKGSITVENGVINFYTTSSSSSKQGNVVYYSDQLVDVTKYKTLTFKAKKTAGNYYVRVGFFSNNTTVYPWEDHCVAGVVLDTSGVEKTYSIDLSGVGDNTYFGVGGMGSAGVATVNVEVSDLYLT